jgi:hypothetical protein
MVNPPKYPNRKAELNCIRKKNITAPKPEITPIMVPKMAHRVKNFNSLKDFMT